VGVNNHNPSCPLCQDGSYFYHKDSQRCYLKCTQCSLVFVPPESRPTQAEEKKQYDLHENSPADEGYRTFLSRLADPLLEKLKPNSSGLDFGCGPGPTLSVILKEAGHSIALYDPIYHPEESVLLKNYDFVTATEVLEHLHHPSKDLKILHKNLKPGGWLGIMTKRVSSKEAFTQWHYIQDPTHVCFWSKATFYWLAKQWNSNVEFPADDVTIFQKR